MSQRRSRAPLAALILALAGLAAAPVTAPAQIGRDLVAVQALLDGDTPLAGARVRVVRGDDELRQDNGTRVERTSRLGVSLLDLTHLPRSFTVEVVPRERLRGSLRAVVRVYRA